MTKNRKYQLELLLRCRGKRKYALSYSNHLIIIRKETVTSWKGCGRAGIFTRTAFHILMLRSEGTGLKS